MAAIAGNYTPKSGLAALPGAEAEVKKLNASLNAVPMRATPEAMLMVLEARLERGLDLLGPAGAVHYAGHGQFDAADPDSSVLFLSDGTALSSLLFRDAEYGGEHQPIIFFNACMIGLGGEVLGDLGGFPGNCLRGGFGAVLGALWEVDDAVAGDIALEFWQRALPATGPGEPVAEVLRDLRAKYSPQQPVPTYLAYTYWGHPRLRLQRLS
jgi:CHAT domain-containing protein